MSRIICPLCIHYRPCSFWIILRELNDWDKLGHALDHLNDPEYRKWLERFARYCVYFRLDEPNLEFLIKCGLDFIYHDFVYLTSTLKEKLKDE